MSRLVWALFFIATHTYWIPASQAQTAGQVIFAKGQVIAIDEAGKKRSLSRRAFFTEGDTLATGPEGRAQIRFIDKALLSLKPNSALSIVAYRKQSRDGQPERAVLNLVKGGFRTITGSIGKGDSAAYKLETPAASIGIRGTNFEIAQESKNTFVIGVYEGGVRVENAAGALDLGFSSNFSYSRVSPTSAP